MRQDDERHCTVVVLGIGNPRYPSNVSFTDSVGRPFRATVNLTTGAVADAKSGILELPESVGAALELKPKKYTVEWHDGPRPAPAATANASEARMMYLEPPTVTELVSCGVSDIDARSIRARERYLCIQKVWPYGVRSEAPEDAAPMLVRYMVEEGVLGQDDVLDVEEGVANLGDAVPPETPEVDATTHYDRRRTEITQLVNERGGGKPLREIASTIGVDGGTSKKSIANAILAAEFPLDHTAID